MREPGTENPCGGGHPVGDSQNQPFQLSFNRLLRVDFQGSRVTSDGGLLLVRELDERLHLTGLIQNLMDSRTGAIRSFPWRMCSDSLPTAGWLGMKTLTMPHGWREIWPFR